MTAAYEAAIARWFADRDAFPDLLIPGFVKETDLVYGENPHQRAAYYSEAGRAAPSALPRGPAPRARALLQQPRRPVRGADAHARADRPGLRDRQAREPVRGRGRGDDRGGLRQRSDLGSDVRVRRRGRRQPPGRAGARREDRRAVRRGAPGARLRRAGARGAPAEAEHADPRRPRAAPLRPRRARLPARPRRHARPGPRLGHRGPREHEGRHRASRPRRTGATCSSPGASAST